MAQSPVSEAAHASGKPWLSGLRGQPWAFLVSGHKTPSSQKKCPQTRNLPCSYKYKDAQERHVLITNSLNTWVECHLHNLAGCSCAVCYKTQLSFSFFFIKIKNLLF